MATTAYSSIAELNDSTCQWKIKARVTRKWDVLNPYKPDKRWRIEMLLLDNSEQHITAKITDYLAKNFTQSLNEGEIYEIEYFKVTELVATQTHRPVHNKLEISFLKETTVKPASEDDQQIARHKFEFVDFLDIPSRSEIHTYTTDVIGRLKCISDLSKVATGPTKAVLVDKRDVQLENERGATIDVCLFAEKAHQLPSNIADVYPPPIILVITSTVVKPFRHKDALSSTSGTKVYINLDIQEATILNQSNAVQPSTIRVIKTTGKKTEEEMYNNRRTVVDTIDQFNCSSEPLEHTCIATIKEVEHDARFAWYYMACPDSKCNRSVDNTGPKPWCKGCNKEIEYPVPRYRLKITIEDSTGSMQVVAFEKEAEQLLQIHVQELCDIYTKDKGSEKVEGILRKFDWLQAMFNIKSPGVAAQQNRDSFILSNVSIVNPLLEKKHSPISKQKEDKQMSIQGLQSGAGGSSAKRKFEEAEEIAVEEMPPTSSSQTENLAPEITPKSSSQGIN